MRCTLREMCADELECGFYGQRGEIRVSAQKKRGTLPEAPMSLECNACIDHQIDFHLN